MKEVRRFLRHSIHQPQGHMFQLQGDILSNKLKLCLSCCLFCCMLFIYWAHVCEVQGKASKVLLSAYDQEGTCFALHVLFIIHKKIKTKSQQ